MSGLTGSRVPDHQPGNESMRLKSSRTREDLAMINEAVHGHLRADEIEDAEERLARVGVELQRLETISNAAMALYERVQMDEAVGVCLSSRVEALALGDALSLPTEARP